jgi:amino acid transporter
LVHAVEAYRVTNVFQMYQVIAISASQACLIVWAAVCLAYIRYYIW